MITTGSSPAASKSRRSKVSIHLRRAIVFVRAVRALRRLCDFDIIGCLMDWRMRVFGEEGDASVTRKRGLHLAEWHIQKFGCTRRNEETAPGQLRHPALLRFSERKNFSLETSRGRDQKTISQHRMTKACKCYGRGAITRRPTAWKETQQAWIDELRSKRRREAGSKSRTTDRLEECPK